MLHLFPVSQKNFYEDRLWWQEEFEMDGADLQETASKPLNQIPPRVSFSYQIKPKSICDSKMLGFIIKSPVLITVLDFRINEGSASQIVKNMSIIRNSQN